MQNAKNTCTLASHFDIRISHFSCYSNEQFPFICHIMKLKKLFEIAVQAGIAADPREKKQVEKALKKIKDKNKKLSDKKKKYADKEAEWNPYLDSRILHATGEENVKHLAIGIDIEVPELLLINELNYQDYEIDAVMVHHPEGRALADLDKVMDQQIDVYAGHGVPENKMEASLRPRMERIWRSIHADNLLRTERTAELLGIPLFGCHTITDHLVWRYMEKQICSKKVDSLGEILEMILEIPEYDYYAQKGNPPIIVNGSRESRPGKVAATEFTGGTNGPEEIMKHQADAGVGTVLSMHATEKTLEVAKEHNVSIIQCSHMASDSLGINLLIDIWQKKGANLKILPLSGFVRVDRTKSKKGKLVV